MGLREEEKENEEAVTNRNESVSDFIEKKKQTNKMAEKLGGLNKEKEKKEEQKNDTKEKIVSTVNTVSNVVGAIPHFATLSLGALAGVKGKELLEKLADWSGKAYGNDK